MYRCWRAKLCATSFYILGTLLWDLCAQVLQSTHLHKGGTFSLLTLLSINLYWRWSHSPLGVHSLILLRLMSLFAIQPSRLTHGSLATCGPQVSDKPSLFILSISVCLAQWIWEAIWIDFEFPPYFGLWATQRVFGATSRFLLTFLCFILLFVLYYCGKLTQVDESTRR